MRKITGQRGFTLIEVVLIILITVIIAFIVIPRSDLTGNRAASAARKLLSDLRYAQQLANTTQSRSGVALISATSYRVFTNNLSGTPATDPLTGSPYIVSMTGNFAGVTLTMNNIDSNIVRFDTLGVPYEGADGAQNALDGNETIDVKNGATVVKTITIAPTTGQVTMD